MDKRWILLPIALGLLSMMVTAQDSSATATPVAGPIQIAEDTATPTEAMIQHFDSTPTVTPTFPPANGNSAQVLGPLSVLDNLHAAVAPFTSVITNPTLSGEPTLLLVNGRRAVVPPGWSLTGEPGMGGLYPHITLYDGPGIHFNWDYINGSAGFAQDGIQLYGNQRYVVRVLFRTDLVYQADHVPFTPSHFQVRGRIYTAQGGFTELPPQSMAGTQASHLAEWVIESRENPFPFIRLEVVFKMEWPIFIGGTFMEGIDILTAPADYRPEFVIYFE